MSQKLRVLFDGWPLAEARGSPPALHVAELLEALPDAIDPLVAIPGRPASPNENLPAEVIFDPSAAHPENRLRWEQATLPALARRAAVDLLHVTTVSSPLFSPVPCLVSPAEPLNQRGGFGGLEARLRASLGRGGLAGAAAVLWPADLPFPALQLPWERLPLRVHSAYLEPQPVMAHLPDRYVLAPGPFQADELVQLAMAWQWVFASLGEDVPLLIVDQPGLDRAELRQVFRNKGEAALQVVDLPLIAQRAAVFQQAAAILSTAAVRPWGDPLLQSLACAAPLAAVESTWSDARVGPAGYLTPAGDARALGAALLTLLVEELVGDALRKAARERWGLGQQTQTGAQDGARLLAIYEGVAAKEGRTIRPNQA